MAVDGKSNEITAIPELLKVLDVTGAIVTIDALSGCQKSIAAPIRAAGGDYVLALKENQPTLYANVQDLFLDGLDNDFANIKHHSCHTVDEGHGRVEHRYYHVIPVPDELAARHPDWTGWRSLGMVYSERAVGDGEPASEVRFFISSLRPEVGGDYRAVRGHWGIENSLHWVLDVCFREDDSRLRKDHGPENLALVRRIAASPLKQETSAKGGTAAKRKKGRLGQRLSRGGSGRQPAVNFFLRIVVRLPCQQHADVNARGDARLAPLLLLFVVGQAPPLDPAVEVGLRQQVVELLVKRVARGRRQPIRRDEQRFLPGFASAHRHWSFLSNHEPVGRDYTMSVKVILQTDC